MLKIWPVNNEYKEIIEEIDINSTQVKSNSSVRKGSDAKLITCIKIMKDIQIFIIHDDINEFYEQYESRGLRYTCVDDGICSFEYIVFVKT